MDLPKPITYGQPLYNSTPYNSTFTQQTLNNW
jgi:hypothetical protein